MAQRLTIFDLSLLDPECNPDKLRRDLKKGDLLFLLTPEEKKLFDKLNFDSARPESINSEFDLASEISGVSKMQISGVGIENKILMIILTRQN